MTTCRDCKNWDGWCWCEELGTATSPDFYCAYANETEFRKYKTHGYWKDMGDFEMCSACCGTHLKEFQSYYGKATWVKTPYCPFCGAKMDLEKSDNK